MSPGVGFSYKKAILKEMILIDGKLLGDKILISLKQKLETFLTKPSLSVIQVGRRKDSEIYVKMKKKACEKVGIQFNLLKVDELVCEERVLEIIKSQNLDYKIHGILVQLPL